MSELKTAKDLQGLYERTAHATGLTASHGAIPNPAMYEAHLETFRLIERIDQAETALAEANAKIERLSAPVSDDERATYGRRSHGAFGHIDIDEMRAARKSSDQPKSIGLGLADHPGAATLKSSFLGVGSVYRIPKE